MIFMNKKIIYSSIAIFAILIIIFGGLFVYNRKTQEAFGTKFNAMNDAYKQVLFASGQNKTETPKLMRDYKKAFQDFYINYRSSPIKPYSSDKEWSKSLDKINSIIVESEIIVNENKYVESHRSLEEVRQIWQEIFSRNKVTMLGFYLTEYHDTMEKAIGYSETKNYDELKKTCDVMKSIIQNVKDTKVDFVGSKLANYNVKLDEMSSNLNSLCDANEIKDDVKINDFSSKLKSTFLAVYLKYG